MHCVQVSVRAMQLMTVRVGGLIQSWRLVDDSSGATAWENWELRLRHAVCWMVAARLVQSHGRGATCVRSSRRHDGQASVRAVQLLTVYGCRLTTCLGFATLTCCLVEGLVKEKLPLHERGATDICSSRWHGGQPSERAVQLMTVRVGGAATFSVTDRRWLWSSCV